MNLNIILLLAFLINFDAIRILFSPGSLVKKSFYKNFIHNLEHKINQTICFYNPYENIDDKNIIISHSFGGTTALYNYLYNNQTNIIGIVLLQSHFNQRQKMPYFGINQNNIHIPVLTILNTFDEKLPLYCSIDDFLVSYQQDIPNKYYLINNGTHFSSFENRLQIEILSSQIESFIKEILKNNFYRMESIKRYVVVKHQWFFQDRNLTNTITRTSFVDFLRSKPRINNSLYVNHKYILYKTNNINITRELETYYHLNIRYNFTMLNFDKNYDYLNNKDTVLKISTNFFKGVDIFTFYMMIEFIIKESINGILSYIQIPQILYTWFTYKPDIHIHNKELICEILCIPINENIVYYKFPSKHKILEFLLKHGMV